MSEEKIFGGKVSSPTSKKRKRSSTKKSKICDGCGQDIPANEMRGVFMYQDTYHQLKAKEYCKDHETKYSDHKCKPYWCGDCNYLINYQIEIQKGK